MAQTTDPKSLPAGFVWKVKNGVEPFRWEVGGMLMGEYHPGPNMTYNCKPMAQYGPLRAQIAKWIDEGKVEIVGAATFQTVTMAVEEAKE